MAAVEQSGVNCSTGESMRSPNHFEGYSPRNWAYLKSVPDMYLIRRSRALVVALFQNIKMVPHMTRHDIGQRPDGDSSTIRNADPGPVVFTD